MDFLTALVKQLQDPLDNPGRRPNLKGRRIRFAKLPAFSIDDRTADILGFLDDDRKAHADELAAHLQGDLVQPTLDDTGFDGIHGTHS